MACQQKSTLCPGIFANLTANKLGLAFLIQNSACPARLIISGLLMLSRQQYYYRDCCNSPSIGSSLTLLESDTVLRVGR